MLCLHFVEHSDCTQNATVTTRRYKQNKHSIVDLLANKFEFKTSEDIDMDPCKAGTCTNLYISQS